MTASFSIVVETENLETTDQQHLLDSLEGLAHQTLSPERACEVLLINSGRVEQSVTDTIRNRFPWIAIHTSGEPVDYYAAKALGAALTTGEVVVFSTATCNTFPVGLNRYSNQWTATRARTS